MAAAETPPAGLVRVELQPADTAGEDHATGGAQAGHGTRMTVQIADPLTGEPLGGLYPQIWLVPDDGSDDRCHRWPGLLKSDGAGSPAILDFTGFEIIEATRSGAIAVVNPDRRLGNADIRAVLSLPSNLSHWAFDTLDQTMAIAVESEAKLRLASINPLAETGTLDTGTPPTAVAIAGGRAYAGTSKGEVVSARFTGGDRTVEPIGTDPVLLVTIGDGGLAAVSGRAGKFVAGAFAGEGFDFGEPVQALSYAPLADAIVALTADGMALLKVQLDDPANVSRLELPSRADGIEVDLAGRWLAASTLDRGELVIHDLATFERKGRFTLDDRLVEMGFSDSFLYVMHQHGGVTRLWLDAPGGEPGISRIAAGPSYAAPDMPSALGRMARIPGHGMLVGVTRDQAAYQINDGDAQAAHLRFSFKAGEPVGLIINSRFPRETRPGQYELRFVPPYGGRHLAVVELDSPATVECVPVNIGGPSLQDLRSAQGGVSVPTLTATMQSAAAGWARIEARVDPVEGIASIGKAMIMRRGGGWFSYVETPAPSRGLVTFDAPLEGEGPFELFFEVSLADGSVRTIRCQITDPGAKS